MKNSNYTFGNRNRDLPAALPNAPNNNNKTHSNSAYMYARMGFDPEFPVDLNAFINNIKYICGVSANYL
jgi:hypothetical protein